MGTAWGKAGSSYEEFSEHLSEAVQHCVQLIDPRPSEKVLDVATGTGLAARLTARRESEVTGVDFSEEMIVAARELAGRDGLAIRFDVGDAESLPYEDGSFDVVLSIFGVIFVSRPEQAAIELARVCKKGGRLGLTTWPPDGTIAQLSREVTAKYRHNSPDTPPLPSPYAWGDSDRVKELLGEWFDLRFEKGCTVLREPNSELIWKLWKRSHGLIITILEKLSPQKARAFHDEFLAFHDRFSDEFGVSMPRDYLVTIGVRR
jgi:SAM-dependent methyltransferase